MPFIRKNSLRPASPGLYNRWHSSGSQPLGKHFSRLPAEIAFLDQSLNSLYKKEEDFLNLLTAFSGIILLIASLSIIGLISFTTVLKKKEIAIRKVLGSSAQSIMRLLSRRFVGLLFLANVMAIPITYYLINLWLSNFTYRIDFHVWPFAIALVVCVFLTAVSLFYHTAMANPVEALKGE